MLPKLDVIKMTIQKIKPLIVCISEYWLSEAIPLAAVEISNFNCYRKDSETKDPSGGVVIYTHKCLKASIVKIPENIATGEKIEWILMKVQYEKYKSFHVSVLYNHPPVLAAAVKNISDYLLHLSSLSGPFYILGDYNIDFAKKNNHLTKKLMNKLEQLNLSQTVSDFTRVSEVRDTLTNSCSISKTIIDLCITNKADSIISTQVDTLNPIADHNNSIVSLNMAHPKKAKPEIKTFRCLKAYTPDRFHETLVANGIVRSVMTDNPNLAANIFSDVFIESLDSVAPSPDAKNIIFLLN